MMTEAQPTARKWPHQAFRWLLLAGALATGRAPAQTVFVSDDSIGTIVRINPGGGASTYASGVGIPEGLAFDASGNLYVADASVSSILKVAPGGAVTTLSTGLGGVNGVAVDSSGNVFATDNAATVYEITPGGSRTVFATGFSEAISLAFDSTGNLFVTDGGTGILAKITPAGAVSSFASTTTGLSGFLDGLAIDPGGNLYVSDITGGIVYKVTSGGTISTFASGLTHPRGLSFDPTTNLLFVTQGFSGINQAGLYEISSTGTVSFLASSLTDANFTAVMPIPEPGTAALLLAGALQLAWWARRSRRPRQRA